MSFKGSTTLQKLQLWPFVSRTRSTPLLDHFCIVTFHRNTFGEATRVQKAMTERTSIPGYEERLCFGQNVHRLSRQRWVLLPMSSRARRTSPIIFKCTPPGNWLVKMEVIALLGWERESFSLVQTLSERKARPASSATLYHLRQS